MNEELYQRLVDNLPEILSSLNIMCEEKSDYYKAVCPNPSHQDTHPSWTIRKDNGVHRCWSCGYNGNIYSLVKDITGQNPYKFTGLSDGFTPYFGYLNSFKSKAKPHERKISTMDIQGDFFDPATSTEVTAYFKERQISSEFLNTFRVTYCKYAKINDTHFFNRVCIPIIEDGRLINIEGRDFTHTQTPKVLYPKRSLRDSLFNIDKLDREKPLYVVEGIMDVAKVWMYLSQNVTCTFGSSLAAHQLEILKTFKKIVVIPDNDEAGKAMMIQIDKSFEKEFYVLPLIRDFKDAGECNSFGDFSHSEILSYNDYLLLTHAEEVGITNSSLMIDKEYFNTKG